MLEVARVIAEKDRPEMLDLLIDTRMRLAEVQIEREDLDLCTEDLEQAMALLKEERPHDHSRAFKVLSLLGLVMQMKGDLPGAIRHMSSGLETCQSRLATVRAELAAAGEGGAEQGKLARELPHLEQTVKDL